MNSRMIRALIAGASCMVVCASTGGAQRSDSTRGYEAQALRYESSWGNARIIRGADGPLVGTAGWFRGFDVEKLVASSAPARAEARAYKTNTFRGSVIGSIGAAATAVGIVVTANGSSNASSPILIIGGVGAMLWGAQHLNIAFSALSRSLWWYNRDLARPRLSPLPTPVPPPARETEESEGNQHPE
jgi:hypothetical protein